MRTLFFSLCSLSAVAAPIIATTTTCTMNGAPAACFLKFETNGSSSASITGLDTDAGVVVRVSAEAWNSPVYPDRVTVDAFASVDFWGSTAGAPRHGLATFQIETGWDGSYQGVGKAVYGSIGGLGFCDYAYRIEECVRSGVMVPFELGTPFEVQAMAHIWTFLDGAGGAGTELRLRLFESDGTPVTIFDSPAPGSDVPEPGTWAMVGLGMIALRRCRPLRARLPDPRTDPD